MAENLSERDLRALMTVVEDGRRDDPTGAMPWAVLDGLRRLISCDSLLFKQLDIPSKQVPIYQEVEGGDRLLEVHAEGRANEQFWVLRRDFLPCSYPYRTGDLISATRWSDFYSPSELRNAPMFAELYGPEGRKHSMLVALPAPPGHTLRLQLSRDSGPDFTERDRLLLELLRPHLHEIYLDAQRRRHGVPRLSRRELEVLQLVAHGRSNADIARELFISVATVRKHMEHVFDRTGVRSRTRAAALVLPHLMIPNGR